VIFSTNVTRFHFNIISRFAGKDQFHKPGSPFSKDIRSYLITLQGAKNNIAKSKKIFWPATVP